MIDSAEPDVVHLQWVGPALGMVVLQTRLGQHQLHKIDAQLRRESDAVNYKELIIHLVAPPNDAA